MRRTLFLRFYRDGLPAAADRDAVTSALGRLAVEADMAGLARLYARDGGTATVDLTGLRGREGLAEVPVDVDVLTTGLVEMVYELATAAWLTIETGDARVFLVDGAQAAHLPGDDRRWSAHTCVDPEELHWWLKNAGPTTDSYEHSPRAVSRSEALRSLFGLRRR